jgi:hypothetical protein
MGRAADGVLGAAPLPHRDPLVDLALLAQSARRVPIAVELDLRRDARGPHHDDLVQVQISFRHGPPQVHGREEPHGARVSTESPSDT